MSQYRRLLSYLRPYLWPQGTAAVAFMLAFSGLESSVPFLAKFTFDQVFTQHHGEALGLAVVGAVVVGLLRGALTFLTGYLTDWIGGRVVADLRNQAIGHLQELDVGFFNRQRAGQIVSRVMADVALVRSAVTDAVTSIFQDTTSLIGLICVAFYMDWVLAILGLIIFPIAALPLRHFSTTLRQNARRQQEAQGRLTAALHENIQGNRVVKAFGREDFESSRIRGFNETLFRLAMASSRIRQLPLTEVLAGFAIAAILWYGGHSVISGTRTQGSFVAFVVTLLLLYDPFKKLIRTNYTIQQGLAGADRVFGLLDTPSAVVERPGARVLSAVQRSIRFENVSFAYDRESGPVLRDINLHIPVGTVVALVGISGGGKSTLADLIPRFYDVSAGRITIDGVDIRDITLASMRAHMAVVTQFTFLFNESVRHNIAYGADAPSADAIIAAARAANAHEFISSLPRGYDTHIGDLGVRLSGGQRQRIAIARAVLRNAPILILDEATSALDTESEGLVQEALERLMANRTTLVVAHRLSTIRHADQIVVVAGGRIVEQGTHDELLATGVEYRKLYDLQFREADTGPPEDAVELLVPKAATK